jgi:excinuclease ABC subunit C
MNKVKPVATVSPALKKSLLLKASTLPQRPGCYLMKNKSREVIYVGKAKNLKNRVSTYFQGQKQDPKTKALVSHIHDVDFILAVSDAESFLLEAQLIKKFKPRYNIRLKDDRSYPYIVIDMSMDFPRLEFARRPKAATGKKILGPFSTGSNLLEIIEILSKLFLLRTCGDHCLKTRSAPCILYQMKRCSAPCAGKVGKESYARALREALKFFTTSYKDILSMVENAMSDAAAREEFELAASFRDELVELTSFTEDHQMKVSWQFPEQDVDVVGFHEGGVADKRVDIVIYLVRSGVLMGRKEFSFASEDYWGDLEEAVADYLFQYYLSGKDTPPSTLVFPANEKIVSSLGDVLGLQGKKINVIAPKIKFRHIAILARDHAIEVQRMRANKESFLLEGLERLKTLLGLKERPRRLESFDVAVWQGLSAAGAQIVFEDGKPCKGEYRHYLLESRPEGNNDYEMMKEMFSRRLKHGHLPDVFVVDGGQGQVNIFKSVLSDAGIEVPVVGIAKAKVMGEAGRFQKEKVEKTDERLIIHGRKNHLSLSKVPALFRILIQMRDEAHRFSRRLHHKKERERLLKT